MNKITPFDYGGQKVRTVVIDGEPWFVLADLCKVLDVRNVKDVRDRLPDGVDQTYPIQDGVGRTQQTTIVNEPGMYEVVIRSDKPEAVTFRRWITSDVLPQIRKTGSYGRTELPSKSEIAQWVIDTERKLEAAEARNAEIEPKAASYDEFMDADGTYSIGSVAKMLGRGQNRLFDELRARRVLIPKGPMRNTPYQPYAHHFRVHAQTFEKRDGQTGTSYTTKVRPSGVDFIAKKLGQPLLTEVTA